MPVPTITTSAPFTRGSPPRDDHPGDRGGGAPLLVVIDSTAADLFTDLPDLALHRFLLVAIPSPHLGFTLNAAVLWRRAGRLRAHRAAVTDAVQAMLFGSAGRYRIMELHFRDSGDPGRRQQRLRAAARTLATRHDAMLLTDWAVGGRSRRDERSPR